MKFTDGKRKKFDIEFFFGWTFRPTASLVLSFDSFVVV
jgi:hypothetical protein